MPPRSEETQRAALQAARERGSITLEEILQLASGSPVDLDEAAELAEQAGIKLVAQEGDPWEQIGRLADEGPGAFRETREGPAPADEIGGGDPATLYLGEISQTPLLSAEEEVQLAQARDAAEQARKQLDAGVEDDEEKTHLEETVRRGAAARRRLIESNLRLVVSIAKKYLGRGLSFLDLVQEGNLGLQKAVDRYDWRKGFRFSTYAYWWIRQAIGRAVAEQGRTIRLPGHVFEQLSKLYSVARELNEQLGRAPTPEEIGQRAGVDPERVREAFQAARMPISLELPVGEDATSTLGDLVADATGQPPAEEAEERVLASTLERALAEYLSPREATILRLRFGLDRGGEERTLGEVGNMIGLSRERVRQQEAEALNKLRRAGRFRTQFQEYAG
jgi:RNA polymerase primary sigma factor